MRAVARIVAEADGRGGTRLAVLRGESPLLPRRTGGRGGGGVTVHLVGGAAGPLRGDDLRVEVAVGAGARLTVRSVAAQLVLPGRAGLPASRLDIRAEVAGTLCWLPEPLIAAAGCDHVTNTRVDIAEGGVVLWREDLVCGRHAEPSGTVRLSTTIRYAGSTLYRHDLSVGPDGRSAAVLGDFRALGALIAVPGLAEGFAPTDRAAVMPLAGPGVLATAVGEDIREVRAVLDPLRAAERPDDARAADRPANATAAERPADARAAERQAETATCG
ncbi:urease accessory protein UreD [Actinoplanes subtropicus]|uniref:urease accessory protein UreD n=1 Tax=Actinoplanes subtropicus TaxID=543632 RepID=UPI000A037DCE|nr:urease accessory protein UreD [Actinoplanes subtropicus]